MDTIKGLASLILVGSLTGCIENHSNTTELCEKQPDLQCDRFNLGDGQCRKQRTELLWHRFEVKKNPTAKNLIQDYEMTAEYNKCLGLATQIHVLNQPELKQNRTEALINSGDDLKTLVERIRKSSSPEALYFLWSQTGDKEAQRSFLQLEGSKALENAEMQYALATFYTSKDNEKTIKLLNRSLELSDGDNINPEAFKSLASLTYQLNRKEEAYIWAMVAKRFEIPLVRENELQILYGFDSDKYQQLDDIAGDVASAIKGGRYKSTLIPSFE